MALKQMGCEYIDGTTNPIDTNKTVYTVPGGAQALMSVISMCNCSATAATGVYLYLVKSGDSPGTANTTLHNRTIAAGQTLEVERHCLGAAGQVVFKSHTTGVNCLISGDES